MLRWYAAFEREKRASVLHAAPLNPYPQPVQVLGANTYKIPVVPVLNPGRLPFAACEYVHALLGVPEGAHILGIEIPQWTEHIRTEEKLDLYTNVRLLAAAEISWTAKEEKDYKDFEERVEKLRNPLKALGIKTAPHEFYSGRAYTDNPNGHISEIWDLWHADPDFEMKCLKK